LKKQEEEKKGRIEEKIGRGRESKGVGEITTTHEETC
jgi:hypothetical protein